MKIDPHKSKEKYLAWKEKNQSQILNVTKANSDIIKMYLQDMEQGLNVAASSKKGSRSYIRLNVLRQRLIFLAKAFEKLFGLETITQISEHQLFQFFLDMRSGVIARKDGKKLKSAKDFVRDFKALLALASES